MHQALFCSALALATSVIPSLLAAQALPARLARARPHSLPAMHNVAATAPLPVGPARDTIACFDCDPRPKHPVAGSVQLVGAMLVPWSYNKFVRHSTFVNVGPKSWWNNISGRWVWDDNSFATNQFMHPYHGSLYFNSFRSNGYNFWQSAVAAWAGAFLWECCGETNPAAPNDLVNTAIGGITLGEMLYRASARVLDNTATGGERAWREIVGGLIDPERGVSRLIHGRTSGVAPNGAERTPSFAGGALDVGWQRIEGSGPSDTATAGGLVRLDYRYGDPVLDQVGRPFSTFAFELNVLTNGGIEEAFTHGSLLGKRVGRPDSPHRHVLGLILNYDYSNNPAYEVGMQSLTGGLISDWHLSERATLHTEAFGRGIVLTGIKSPQYIVVGEGRDYDYGPGIGARFDATLELRGRGSLRIGYEQNWIRSVNGVDANHTLGRALVRARVALTRNVGFGAGIKQRHIHSYYRNYPDDDQDTTEFRLFASMAVPHWTF